MHLTLFCSFLSAYHRTTEYIQSSAVLAQPTPHTAQARCTSSHPVTLAPSSSYTVNPQSLIPNLLSVSTAQSNIHITPLTRKYAFSGPEVFGPPEMMKMPYGPCRQKRSKTISPEEAS